MKDAYIHITSDGPKGSPLLITAHGTGGNERQFEALAGQMLPGASLVSPRGDVSEGGAARFFRRTGEGVYDMADLARATEKMAGFIAEHVARTGATRVLGLGYSNGANILAAVSFRHPELFTDLILMHPLIPFAPAPQPGLAGRRVLITAGRRDPICPVSLTEGLIGYYTAQGAGTEVFWHPGGHEVTQGEVAAAVGFAAPLRQEARA